MVRGVCWVYLRWSASSKATERQGPARARGGYGEDDFGDASAEIGLHKSAGLQQQQQRVQGHLPQCFHTTLARCHSQHYSFKYMRFTIKGSPLDGDRSCFEGCTQSYPLYTLAVAKQYRPGLTLSCTSCDSASRAEALLITCGD